MHPPNPESRRNGAIKARTLRSTAMLVAMLLLTLSAQAQTKPRIVLSESNWDFGEIRQSETRMTKMIRVTNEGDATLDIKGIRVTCGCVEGDLPSQKIEPGQGATLELRLRSSNTVGAVSKHCVISSNDPERPTVVVSIKGTIHADWHLSKTRITLGNCDAGKVHEATLQILHELDFDLDLVAVHCADPNVSLDTEVLERNEGEQPGWLLRARILETAPPGAFAAGIFVTTNHPTNPRLHAVIYARIQGPVRIRPFGRLRLGRMRAGETRRKELRVECDPGAACEVSGVSSPEANIRATIADAIQAEGRTIQVEVTSPTTTGPHQAVLEIHTTHPGQPLVRVPVDWTTLPPKARDEHRGGPKHRSPDSDVNPRGSAAKPEQTSPQPPPAR